MASERKFINENIRRVLLKEYFQKETEMAGFGGIDIQRTPMGTRVTLVVERPGMVIGRKGAKIKDLTRTVSEKYGFDNPQIEVQECKNSAVNPQIMAQKLALALERGWHFRRAGHSTLRRIMDSDAKGCQVKLCGKLTGQRHRTEKFKWGHIKFCGEPALTTMDRGYAIAKKKLGLIGVSVDIMKADAKLPDEIKIFEIPDLLEVAEVKGEYELQAEEAAGEETSEKEETSEVAPKEEDVSEDKKGPEEEDMSDDKEKRSTSRRKAKREERRKEQKEEIEAPSETSDDEPEKDEPDEKPVPNDIKGSGPDKEKGEDKAGAQKDTGSDKDDKPEKKTGSKKEDDVDEKKEAE